MSKPKNSSGSYTHLPSPLKSYLLSILAIIGCSLPAVVLSWVGLRALGLTGIPLALLTVFSSMILATALFALLSAIGRALNITK
jgi:hypothetical protein